MVRLLLLIKHSSVVHPRSFNPTMVRLLRTATDGVGTVATRFNPTMVRLLQNLIRATPLISLRFNPTMVRLLPSNKSISLVGGRTFQSHNGAIAAQNWLQVLWHR